MIKKVNYLAALYGLEKIEGNDIDINKEYEYKINGKEYEDPDNKSFDLYMQWQTFLVDKMPDGRFELDPKALNIRAKINEKTFLLSSDYIGPSKYYAAKAFRANNKDVCKEMAEIFNICRCFEGHIIWPKGQIICKNSIYLPYGPRGKNSINISRGGEMGVFDRFDVTLCLLKKYYKFFIEKNYFNTQIYNRAEAFINLCDDVIDIEKNGFRLFNLFLSFELSSEWFALFKKFDNFIRTFELQDFIMNGEPVIWGKKDKLIELNGESYIEYIDGCRNTIKKRGEHLQTKILQ